jgi:hypothetical protein
VRNILSCRRRRRRRRVLDRAGTPRRRLPLLPSRSLLMVKQAELLANEVERPRWERRTACRATYRWVPLRARLWAV